MKLSGLISIDLPRCDVLTASDHRGHLEDILGYIRDTYPEATLVVRERRERRAAVPAAPAPRAQTGALNQYAED